jgi:hypothetical protein
MRLSAVPLKHMLFVYAVGEGKPVKTRHYVVVEDAGDDNSTSCTLSLHRATVLVINAIRTKWYCPVVQFLATTLRTLSSQEDHHDAAIIRVEEINMPPARHAAVLCRASHCHLQHVCLAAKDPGLDWPREQCQSVRGCIMKHLGTLSWHRMHNCKTVMGHGCRG